MTWERDKRRRRVTKKRKTYIDNLFFWTISPAWWHFCSLKERVITSILYTSFTISYHSHTDEGSSLSLFLVMPFLLVANNILKRYISFFVMFEEEIQKVTLKIQSHYCMYLSLQLLTVSMHTITAPKDVKRLSHYTSTFSPAFTNSSISSLEIVYSWSYERPYYILPSGCGHLCSPHS